MSQSLCEKKIDKQRLTAENIILTSELAKKRENFMLKKGWLEHQKSQLEKQFNNVQPSNMLKFANRIENEKEVETSRITKEKIKQPTYEELLQLKNELSICKF